MATGSLVAAGAVLGAACDDASPSGSTNPLSNEPESFFSDDFTTDRHGWGDDWLSVRYESAWWIAGGVAVSEVPVGIPKALAPGKGHTEYMAQPVVHPKTECASPVVKAQVLVDGPVEAGLIACASFDESYAVLLRSGKALLCRYGITDRSVLAQKSLPSGGGWFDVSLAATPAGAVEAAVVDEAGTRVALEARVDDPLPAGFVGTLVNPLSDEQGGKGKFRSFRAGASDAAPPRPRFSYRFAGAVVSDGEGFRVRAAARTVVPSDIDFEVSTSEDFSESTTFSGEAPAGDLGGVRAWLNDLAGATTYHWRPVTVSSQSVAGPTASFRTPPAPGSAVRFAFASCTSGRVTKYPSFERMKSFEPEFLLHSGDWGYADLTSTDRRGDHFQARWIRQLRAPEVAALLDQTPLMFWQDDHDYAADNGWSETCQPYSIKAFDELHANSSDDYFDLRWGDVHLWCLDCRLHATDPEAPDDADKSRIGFEQKAWLKEGMTASDAPVKIVASAMVFRNKDPDDPGWQSVYTYERDELLEFFSGVDGTVAILSGDSHGQRLIHHFEFGELWEINSSGTDFPGGGQDNYDPEHTVVNIGHRSGFAIVDVDPAGPGRSITIKSVATDDGSTLFEKALPVA